MKRESNLVMPQQTFSDIVMSICKPVKVEHDFCAHLVLFTTGDDINQIDTVNINNICMIY